MSEGFTQFPNNLLEAIIRVGLPSRELAAFLAIVRMTTGWHKTSDTIALRQFADAMGGKDRRNMDRVVRNLEKRKMIFIRRHGGKAAEYEINSNLDEWRHASAKTHVRNASKPQDLVVAGDTSACVPQDASGVSVATHSHVSLGTPSEETLKEKKERIKEIRGEPAPFLEGLKESASETRPAGKGRSLMAEYLDWKAITKSDLTYQKWVSDYA